MTERKVSLHDLPRFTDKLSYLYIDHAVIEQEATAISITRDDGSSVAVPIAALAVLLLGPGTTLTHAAVKSLADNNCQIVWVGEHGVRFYAHGLGGARSSRNLLRQAFLATNETARMQVVIRMYCMRFSDRPPTDITLQQLRGREGIRVREAYARAAQTFGVRWSGRNYDRGNWDAADPINRALSAANACLYSLCQAAILSGGYSPALGFIHTGKQMSFVYDIADLYKAQHMIPLAFREASTGSSHLEARVRRACRDLFRSEKVTQRILPDIASALAVPLTEETVDPALDNFASDGSRPAQWWQPEGVSPELPIKTILTQTIRRPWDDVKPDPQAPDT